MIFMSIGGLTIKNLIPSDYIDAEIVYDNVSSGSSSPFTKTLSEELNTGEVYVAFTIATYNGSETGDGALNFTNSVTINGGDVYKEYSFNNPSQIAENKRFSVGNAMVFKKINNDDAITFSTSVPPDVYYSRFQCAHYLVLKLNGYKINNYSASDNLITLDCLINPIVLTPNNNGTLLVLGLEQRANNTSSAFMPLKFIDNYDSTFESFYEMSKIRGYIVKNYENKNINYIPQSGTYGYSSNGLIIFNI